MVVLAELKRGGVGKKEKKLMNTYNSVVLAWGEGEVEEGTGGTNGDGRRLDLGGEDIVQCTEDVLWDCVPETCIILLTSISPINSIKSEKKEVGTEQGGREIKKNIKKLQENRFVACTSR